jgi:hypothetical protein
MPRKYTKKKGRKIKRGGTLTKTLSDGENIMNDEIIILKNRLDELEMKLEICCRDMVQGANTIQRVYRGHQGRNTFKQTRRTMKPNVTDALLDLPQDVGDLITSQVTKYKKGMTYDEFVQYIKNKDLYGCFNIISSNLFQGKEIVGVFTHGKIGNKLNRLIHGLSSGVLEPPPINLSETHEKIHNCLMKLETSRHEIDIILFSWFQNISKGETNYIHIDDLNKLTTMNNDFSNRLKPQTWVRILKELYKNLPEYREENLREAYQYYIEQWNKLYL